MDSIKPLQNPVPPTAVDAFLRQVAVTPSRPDRVGPSRLIFAMDATASREPTWDRASHIQAAMFTETAALGGLAVQLAFYRGLRDLRVSPWCTDGERLRRLMTSVRCAAGLTQIARVLTHVLTEAHKAPVEALVFVGDCMEEERDRLAGLAGELGLLGVPAFMFQEGRDPLAERSFRDVARLSGGAYCPFDGNSPEALRDLLCAVAVYAAGGRAALEDLGARRGGAILALARRLTKD